MPVTIRAASMPILLPYDHLALETRNKHTISNNLNRGEPGDGRTLETKKYIDAYRSATPRTRVPCLKYNCHGLTFAARRTAIENSDEVATILRDDGYEQVTQNQAMPGDIVIWRAAAVGGGEIIHSGIVVEVPKDMLVPVPRVVSKWGYAHECIHPVNDTPYSGSTVEYYRVVS